MYVYKITNKINGKFYIGIRSESIRKSNSYFGGGKLIKNAIKKYGKENFTKEVLQEVDDIEELKNAEERWISFFGFPTNELMYNVTGGREGAKGYKHTKKTKDKMSKNSSKYWKNKKFSEKTKNKISNAMRGNKNHFYGKHHTEESKEKISINKTGKYTKEKCYQYRSDIKIGNILELKAFGFNCKRIAQIMNCHPTTVYNRIKESC